MKKTMLLVSALCVLGMAQAQKRGMASFGIKAGANFSNPKVELNNSELDTKTKVGLNAGVFVTIPAGSSLSIQPEVTYSSLGYKLNNSDDKVDLNYVSIPVLIKYNFAGSGFGIYAGPQLGFLASAKYKPANGSNVDIHDNFKGTDVGVVFGSEFSVPNTPVVLSGRYQVGLKNVYEPAAGNPDIKNNGATVTLGFKF